MAVVLISLMIGSLTIKVNRRMHSFSHIGDGEKVKNIIFIFRV
jgi:hypothetical protein